MDNQKEDNFTIKLIETWGTPADRVMLMAWRAGLCYHPDRKVKRRFPFCLTCDERRNTPKS